MEIERPEFGEGNSRLIKGLEIYENEEKIYETETFEIEVPEKTISKGEESKYIKDAIDEIEAEYYGDTNTADCVSSDVVMRNNYVNGLVEAEWTLSNYDYISPDGTYLRENVKSKNLKGEVVNVQVLLRCGQTEQLYEFAINVEAPELTIEEEVEQYIKTNSKELYGGNTFSLPETINVRGKDYNLTWKETKNVDWFFFIPAAAVFIVFIRYEFEERKRRKQVRRNNNLSLRYPEIVSEFALLTGAGFSLRNALKNIVEQDEKRDDTHTELRRIETEISNGMSEYTAFVKLGERCEVPEYRRLSLLISQNIKHGGRYISDLLYAESEKAFEERKNMAKKLGGEAGTKMMIPMFMMLIIVLVITIYPAFCAMNF